MARMHAGRCMVHWSLVTGWTRPFPRFSRMQQAEYPRAHSWWVMRAGADHFYWLSAQLWYDAYRWAESSE